LLTLANNVGLGFSGLFSVGASYAGVSHPPGFPVWTLYAWVSTSLLDISNTACRVAVSSAIAGALACGMIALMTARGGGLFLEDMQGCSQLNAKEGNLLRLISGCVAGMAFGFDGAFWCRAVIADPWPLSMLLFCAAMATLMRWLHDGQRRFLYAAFFLYGLTISDNQCLLLAGPGLQVIILLGNPQLGRNLFLISSVFIGGIILADSMDWLEPSLDGTHLHTLYWLLAIFSAMFWIGSAMKTRSLLTEWTTACLSSVAFLLGSAMYLYAPVASMTNPPVNWSYARTVPGFFHLLSRGQYSHIHPTDAFSTLLRQIGLYFEIGLRELGLIYLVAAVVPFFFLRRMRVQQRAWMLGSLAVFACLSLLMLVLVNPSADRQNRELNTPFFSASHVIVAVWAGYGFMLFAALVHRRRETKSPIEDGQS
jgi:hypothetical protein